MIDKDYLLDFIVNYLICMSDVWASAKNIIYC